MSPPEHRWRYSRSKVCCDAAFRESRSVVPARRATLDRAHPALQIDQVLRTRQIGFAFALRLTEVPRVEALQQRPAGRDGHRGAGRRSGGGRLRLAGRVDGRLARDRRGCGSPREGLGNDARQLPDNAVLEVDFGRLGRPGLGLAHLDVSRTRLWRSCIAAHELCAAQCKDRDAGEHRQIMLLDH